MKHEATQFELPIEPPRARVVAVPFAELANAVRDAERNGWRTESIDVAAGCYKLRQYRRPAPDAAMECANQLPRERAAADRLAAALTAAPVGTVASCE